MLKKERDQDVAHKGWQRVSRALGSFQAFRDNRTNCSDLPAIGLPGWLLLLFTKPHLPPWDPAAARQCCMRPVNPMLRPGVQGSNCISACSVHQARGAGSGCLLFPMQPSTSDWRQHVNASLTNEVHLQSAQLGHQILVKLKIPLWGEKHACGMLFLL